MKIKNKYMYLSIAFSIFYTCIVQMARARSYIWTPPSQRTGVIFLCADFACWVMLCLPFVGWSYEAIKDCSIKTIKAIFRKMFKENWLVILLYMILLFVIWSNCSVGIGMVDVFGKQMEISAEHANWLVFFYYIFDNVFILCVMEIAPILFYLALRDRWL